jgi:predicted secreted protein
VFTKPANYFKNLFKKQVEVFNDLVDRIAIEKGTDPLKEKYYTLDAIDAKCSGLLTHVSLMITATVFLYTDAKHGSVTKDFLLCEITVYILIALSLLYCLNLIAPHSFRENQSVESAVSEACARRLLIHRFALSSTVITTIVVLATLAMTHFF